MGAAIMTTKKKVFFLRAILVLLGASFANAARRDVSSLEAASHPADPNSRLGQEDDEGQGTGRRGGGLSFTDPNQSMFQVISLNRAGNTEDREDSDMDSSLRDSDSKVA